MTEASNKILGGNLTISEIGFLEQSADEHGLFVDPGNLIDVAGLLESNFIEVQKSHEGLHAFANDDGIRLLRFRNLYRAAQMLVEDVRDRHPGEDLQCKHMIALNAAVAEAARAT